MQEIMISLKYVVQGNLFWQSMGMTTATAIFLGAILFHQSDKTSFYRAFVTVTVYSFFLIFTAGARVSPHIIIGVVSVKTYASVITTIMVTISYLLGLLIGYWLLRGKEKDVPTKKQKP